MGVGVVTVPGLRSPLVLGIETSCDDTACALVDGDGRVAASAVSSQIAVHRPFGGVVPEIASREHLANWRAVAGEALARVGVGFEAVEVVAATRGPGLVGSLLVGLSLGRAFAWARELPFHAVHHLEGHVFSPWLAEGGAPAAPVPERFVALVVSGGHTSLFRVAGATIATIAETRDDAFGEAFDKLGKRLGLPYPQGPEVDRLAELGDARRRRLPRLAGGDELFFSYSGLKTQATLELERLEAAGVRATARLDEEPPLPAEVLDLVAGFRDSAVRQVLDRLDRLHRREPFAILAVSGGAAANRELRRRLPEWAAARAVELRLVPLAYAGDNAAMIAFAAVRRERLGRRDDPLAAVAASRLAIGA
jgi:N6-L-threonylcarbamoyladenine synthase